MTELLRHLLAPVAGIVVVAVGACGGGADPAASDRSSTTTVAAGLPGGGDAPAGTVAEGPFCESIQGIQRLGAGDAATGAAEQVLAQNEAMLDLLDEASATVPEGAPADVESLFDDYRQIAEAIGAAGGDVEAAYTAIQRDDPRLAARLFNETAHLPAFEFFVRECGISFQ